MKKDFINKFIEKAFENKLSFEEWAEKHGIDITHQIPVRIRHRKRFVLRFASVVASVILLASVALGLVLSGVLSTEPDPRVFTEDDAISQRITLDYLYENEQLLLFNREQILNEEDDLRASRQVVIGEEDFLLSYTVNPLLFMTSDEQNAFSINFRVRMHRYFIFAEYERFSSFTQNITINNVNLYFHILANNRALVRFEHNYMEYFLIIDCFFEQDITCDTLTMLLSELII